VHDLSAAATTTYSAVLPFGKSNGVSVISLIPDLVAGMDFLSEEVLDELQESEVIIRRRLLRSSEEDACRRLL
jgi:hypothetical protein